MRVSRYPGKWSRRVMRATPAQRAAVVEIATALAITVDGVCRLSLRAYADKRGVELPGWKAVERAKAQGFVREIEDDNGKPRVWMRLRDNWVPVVESLFHGECDTFAGVVRESITEFYAAGPEAWRSAMSTPPAPQASTASGSVRP